MVLAKARRMELLAWLFRLVRAGGILGPHPCAFVLFPRARSGHAHRHKWRAYKSQSVSFVSCTRLPPSLPFSSRLRPGTVSASQFKKNAIRKSPYNNTWYHTYSIPSRRHRLQPPAQKKVIIHKATKSHTRGSSVLSTHSTRFGAPHPLKTMRPHRHECHVSPPTHPMPTNTPLPQGSIFPLYIPNDPRAWNACVKAKRWSSARAADSSALPLSGPDTSR